MVESPFNTFLDSPMTAWILNIWHHVLCKIKTCCLFSFETLLQQEKKQHRLLERLVVEQEEPTMQLTRLANAIEMFTGLAGSQVYIAKDQHEHCDLILTDI